eukprot:gene3471-biopygen5164
MQSIDTRVGGHQAHWARTAITNASPQPHTLECGRRRDGAAGVLEGRASAQQQQQQQQHLGHVRERLPHPLHLHQLQQQASLVPDWQLTCMISSAGSCLELQQVIAAHRHHFVPLHTAAAWAKLAKLVTRQQRQSQLLPQQRQQLHCFTHTVLLPLLSQHAHALSPRSLSNVTWALGKLELLPPKPLLLLLQQKLAAAAVAGMLEPQHISSVLYAIAQWQQQQWWCAVLPQGQSGSSPTPSAAAVRAGIGISSSFIDLLMGAAEASFHHFGPQALSNSLYAAAVLQLQPSQTWQQSFWQRSGSSENLAAAEPQHVSNMLYAAARLKLRPPQCWQAAVLADSALKLQHSTSQGCSNMLWAVARLGWGSAVLAGSRTRGGSGSGSSSADCESSSSGGGSRSSSICWLDVFFVSTMGQLGMFSAQGITNCCWALGKMQQQQQQRQLADLPHFSGWLQRLLAVSQSQLAGFTPLQLSNTIWGLATCISSSSSMAAWLQSFLQASGPKLLGFSMHDASQTLVALAKLHIHPSSSWMNLFELLLLQHVESCDSQVIANSMWAMNRLRHDPSQRLLQALLPEVCRRLIMSAPINLSASSSVGDNSSSSSSSSSSIGSRSSSTATCFTEQGLTVLLLSLVKVAPPSDIPGDFWTVVAHTVVTTNDSVDGDDAGDGGQQVSDSGLVTATRSGRKQQQGGSDGSAHGSVTVTATNSTTSSSSSSSNNSTCDSTYGNGSCAHAGAALSTFAPQSVAALAGAAALSGSEQGEVLVTAGLHRLAQCILHDQQQQQQHHVSLLDVSMVLWAAARLQLQPSAALLLLLTNHALHLLQCQASGSSSSSSSTTVGTVQQECGKPVGAVIYALAVMGFHPGSVWFERWWRATKPLLAGLKPWTLAMLLWGSVWLEQVPPWHWTLAWSQAWQQQQQQQQQQQFAVARQVAAAAGKQGMRVADSAVAAAGAPVGKARPRQDCSSSSCNHSRSGKSSSCKGSSRDAAVLLKLCQLLCGVGSSMPSA